MVDTKLKLSQSALKSKCFYETIFIFLSGLSFLAWIMLIFYRGRFSSQFNLFIQQMEDFLADFTNVIGYSSMKDPYNNEVYTGLNNKIYPPLPYFIAWCFSRIVNIRLYYYTSYFLAMRYEPLFMIMFIIMLGIIVILQYEFLTQMKNGKRYIKTSCAMLIIFSQPLIFTLERGNFLLLTELFIIIFFAYYDSDSTLKRELALISLGLAFGLKLTPALLGIILLYEKKWYAAIRCAIYGLIFFLVPFLFFKGGLSNIPLLIRNLRLLLEPVQGWFDLNLANILNLLGIHCSQMIGNIVNTIVSILLLVFAAFMSKWERAMVVALVLLILPKFSQYYCIIYILPTFIMFLNEEKHRWSDMIILVVSIMIVGCFQLPFLSQKSGLFLAKISMITLTILFMCRGIGIFVCNLINSFKQWKIKNTYIAQV